MNALSKEDIKAIYPDAFSKDGELSEEKVISILLAEIADLQDQMKEKDFQILRITERIDDLEKNL